MYMSYHARQYAEPTLNEQAASCCQAVYAYLATAEQDLAIARETMRHTVLAAHASADSRDVEHVVTATMKSGRTFAATWQGSTLTCALDVTP